MRFFVELIGRCILVYFCRVSGFSFWFFVVVLYGVL